MTGGGTPARPARHRHWWCLITIIVLVVLLAVLGSLNLAGVVGSTTYVKVPGPTVTAWATTAEPVVPSPPATVTASPRPRPTVTITRPAPGPTVHKPVVLLPFIPLDQGRLNLACRQQHKGHPHARAVLPPPGDDAGLNIKCVDSFGTKLGGLNLTDACVRFDGVDTFWIDVHNDNDPNYVYCVIRHK